MKPNVLVVTRNLPPLVGGMERLIFHLIDELRVDYKVHVIGPVGCRNELPQDVNVHEVRLRPMVCFLLQIMLVALWLTIRYQPKIILAGSGLTAPFVWLAARLFKTRCIVYLHGLDIAVSHRIYQYLWIPFIRCFDGVCVNSNHTKKLAIQANIPHKCISVLHPGVELPKMDESLQRKIEFRKKHDFGDIPIMLYVGRVTPRKGLFTFVNKMLSDVLTRQPVAKLLVVGDNPNDAILGADNETARVQSALEVKELESHVRFMGQCSDEELGDAYFAADILIFPVQQKENDIEGFGMVAIEAAAHGLPTVAFSVGGVSDAVGNGVSGRLIVPGDNSSFVQVIVDILTKTSLLTQPTHCRNFAEKFSWERFGSQLREICWSIENRGIN